MKAMLILVNILSGEPMVDASAMGPYTYDECVRRAETMNQVPTNPSRLIQGQLVLSSRAVCSAYVGDEPLKEE